MSYKSELASLRPVTHVPETGTVSRVETSGLLLVYQIRLGTGYVRY